MKYLFCLLTATLFFACGPSGSGSESPDGGAESPRITVTVSGAPQGQASLIATFADQRYRLDSASIDAEGRMVFQRDQPYPAGLLFLLLPNQSYLQLLVDQDQTFSLSTQAGNLVGAMQVEGSLDNELLYRNLQFEADIQPRFQDAAARLQAAAPGTPAHAQVKEEQNRLVAERKAHLNEIFESYPDAFFTKFKMAGQNPEPRDIRNPDGSIHSAAQVYHYRRDFWDNVDFSDLRLLRTPVIANKLNRYIKELTSQHPDSIIQATDFLVEKVQDHPEYYKFIVNWIVLEYEPLKTTLMDPQAVHVHMVQNYFTYDRAFWSDSAEVYAVQLRAHEMANSLIGQKGPDVQAKDPGGQLRSISEITAPYVVVYMFNPTCEHCMEQTPKLVQFYREWKNKGVEVFAIALDTNDQEWRDYIAKNNMTWTNVFDPTNKAIYATYFVDNTPEIYILNPDRIIIGKNLKVSQIETVINRDREKEG